MNSIKILNGSISIYHWCRLWFGLSSRWGSRCDHVTHNGWAREIGRKEGRKETRNLTFFYNVGVILKQAGNISDENVQITSYSSRHSWKLERRTLEQCQPNQKSHVPALHALHSPFQFVLERNCIKILNGSISIYHWCRLWFGLSSRLGLRCAPDPLPLTHNGEAREIGRTEGRTDGRKDPFNYTHSCHTFVHSLLGGFPCHCHGDLLCFNVGVILKQAGNISDEKLQVTVHDTAEN